MAHPNFPDNVPAGKAPKLLDMVREKLRLKHYSLRTEQAYVDWIKRYILCSWQASSARDGSGGY